jgi:anti-anti-sigma factor
MTERKTVTTKVGTRKILNPKSSLTFQNCQEFEATLMDYIRQEVIEIIVDCKSVSLFDSEALELLVRIHEQLKSRGGSLKLVGLNDLCRDILIATRLVNFFQVYEDIHEAMRRHP